MSAKFVSINSFANSYSDVVSTISSSTSVSLLLHSAAWCTASSPLSDSCSTLWKRWPTSAGPRDTIISATLGPCCRSEVTRDTINPQQLSKSTSSFHFCVHVLHAVNDSLELFISPVIALLFYFFNVASHKDREAPAWTVHKVDQSVGIYWTCRFKNESKQLKSGNEN